MPRRVTVTDRTFKLKTQQRPRSATGCLAIVAALGGWLVALWITAIIGGFLNGK